MTLPLIAGAIPIVLGVSVIVLDIATRRKDR